MKQILLIGDSIRMGYDRYVKESFADVAEVCYPTVNAMTAANVLRFVHTWADDLGLDNVAAVHWNAGLWDTVRIYGDEPLTPIAVYAAFVERVTRRLQFLFPDAKLIFASSTPCIEEAFLHEFEYRTNADIERYNAAAIEMVQKYGCEVNDLYSLLKNQPLTLHSDQTHFYTPDATELIGSQVNAVLCHALDISPTLLTPPDKCRFTVPVGVKSDAEMYRKEGRLYRRIRP